MKRDSISMCSRTWLGVLLLSTSWLLVPLAASAGLFDKPVLVASKWGVFEQAFKSSNTYTNPLAEANLAVTFTSPLGDKHVVWAFWDGGRTWRVRFSPDFPGVWKFTTRCSDPSNDGLDNVTGDFVCSASTDESVFDKHGPVQVARDHYHLEHADHTPFFWLSDNAGRGALESTTKQWEFYALVRAKENFTAARWIAATGTDREQRTAWNGDQINVEFFKALDAKVSALNRDGLLDVIVPFSLIGMTNSGFAAPSDEQAILLLRYMVARWGANDVAWFLPGDDGSIARWKKIGHAVFVNTSHAPVILDATEDYMTLEMFRNEHWVDVFGYHYGREFTNDLGKWLVTGSITNDWKKYPPRPYINISSAYENEEDGVGHPRVNAATLRHIAGESLLATPTAGIGYGAHGVWNWDTTTNMDSNGGRALANWQIALYLPGAKQLGTWSKFFQTFDFGRLRPAPELVVNQPGSQSPGKYIAAAETEFEDMALLYLPEGGDVEVNIKSLPKTLTGTWANGSTGETIPVSISTDSGTAKLSAPGAGDWFLLIQAAKK
ncbi:MAG TPA: DUF4038 domain-containing protein [Verrucomicrobiae bacterium]|nr:DUF4038 domain-containing protein [Verrucomicrobiae bacterium]